MSTMVDPPQARSALTEALAILEKSSLQAALQTGRTSVELSGHVRFASSIALEQRYKYPVSI
jgi:hypothetical protein